MKQFIVVVVAALCILPLAGAKDATSQAFTGEVSDTQCAFNIHSHNSSHNEMLQGGTMGDTPEDCVRACFNRGGGYALVDTANQKVYHLDNSTEVGRFAGRKDHIRAVYDRKANLLHVVEINRAID
jgi:hypothetical protein